MMMIMTMINCKTGGVLKNIYTKVDPWVYHSTGWLKKQTREWIGFSHPTWTSLMPSSLVTLFRYQWGSLKLRTTSSEWNCWEARKLAQAFSPDTFQQIDIMLIVGAVHTSLENGCLAPESFNWQAGFSPHIKLTCQKHRKSWHFRTSEITRHQQFSPPPSSKYLAHLGPYGPGWSSSRALSPTTHRATAATSRGSKGPGRIGPRL